MDSVFVEATQSVEDGPNWGKFMVGRFTAEEWARKSAMPSGNGINLLSGRGWSPHHLLVFDLQTGEGAIFAPGGSATDDLQKHRIWVCPMFEPFLIWLYQQDLADLSTLPDIVELDAPFEMFIERQPGLAAAAEAASE